MNLNISRLMAAWYVIFASMLCQLIPISDVDAQDEVILRTTWGNWGSKLIAEKHVIQHPLSLDTVTPVFLMIRNGSSLPLTIRSCDAGSLSGKVVLPSESILPGNVGVVEIALAPKSMDVRSILRQVPLWFETSGGRVVVSLDLTYASVANFKFPFNLVQVSENGQQLGNIPLVLSEDVPVESVRFRMNESSPSIVPKIGKENGLPIVALKIDRNGVQPGREYDLEMLRNGKVVGTTKLKFKLADSVTVTPDQITFFQEISNEEPRATFLRGYLLLVTQDLKDNEKTVEYFCDLNKKLKFDATITKLSQGIFRVEVKCPLLQFQEMTMEERNACKLAYKRRLFARPLNAQIGELESVDENR